MWPVQIIVDSPFLNDLTGMAITAEQVLVEALVPQPPVKAFDEAVLHRLARRDVVPVDAMVLLPFQMAFEVSSVPLSLTTISG